MQVKKVTVIVLCGLLSGVPCVHQPNRLLLSQPLSVPSLAHAAGSPTDVTWETLEKLDYKRGKIPAAIKQLNGTMGRVPGFIVPLEDEETVVSEFLLVPYFGACIHVPPPPPNQIVHVLMEKKKKITFDFWQPLWVEGRLKVAKSTSPYGDVSYQMTGISTQPLEEEGAP